MKTAKELYKLLRKYNVVMFGDRGFDKAFADFLKESSIRRGKPTWQQEFRNSLIEIKEIKIID